jgi:hypothetical protein
MYSQPGHSLHLQLFFYLILLTRGIAPVHPVGGDEWRNRFMGLDEASNCLGVSQVTLCAWKRQARGPSYFDIADERVGADSIHVIVADPPYGLVE